MTTCPNCGKMAGLHSSILQGCVCQYSMQAMKEGKDFTIRKPWVGLTDEEKVALCKLFPDHLTFNAIDALEAKLREKNNG